MDMILRNITGVRTHTQSLFLPFFYLSLTSVLLKLIFGSPIDFIGISIAGGAIICQLIGH